MTLSPPLNPPARLAHFSAVPAPRSAPSLFARRTRSPAPCSPPLILPAREPLLRAPIIVVLAFFKIEIRKSKFENSCDEPAHGEPGAIRHRRYPGTAPRDPGRDPSRVALRAFLHLRAPRAVTALPLPAPALS